MEKIPDFLALVVAKRCHEANNEYRKSIGEKIQEDSLMDGTAEKRTGLVQAVQWLYANPDATAEDAHDQWRKSKRAAGWIPAARTNEPRREHACLYPWASLPLPQRRKDEIFLETAFSCFTSLWFAKALGEHKVLSELGIDGSAGAEGLELVRKGRDTLLELAALFPKIEKTTQYAELQAVVYHLGVCLETVEFSKKYTKTLYAKDYPVLTKYGEDGKLNPPGPYRKRED